MLASSEMPPRPGPGEVPARGVFGLALLSSLRPLPESWISMPTPLGTSARDDHRLGGRRVARGVVQQVGEDQREVVHQTAVDAEFGQMTQLDAVEVLDPADAATHHAQQALRSCHRRPGRSDPPSTPILAARQSAGPMAWSSSIRPWATAGSRPCSPCSSWSRPRSLLVRTDAVAHADDRLFGGGRAVELRLDADQRGPEHLAQFGLEVGTDLGALLDGRQDVVDGVTGAQPAHRVGQLLVGEPGDRGQLVTQLRSPGLVLLGEAGLVRPGLLGQPVLTGPVVLRQPHLVRLCLLGELCVQPGALGGELALQAGRRAAATAGSARPARCDGRPRPGAAVPGYAGGDVRTRCRPPSPPHRRRPRLFAPSPRTWRLPCRLLKPSGISHQLYQAPGPAPPVAEWRVPSASFEPERSNMGVCARGPHSCEYAP